MQELFVFHISLSVAFIYICIRLKEVFEKKESPSSAMDLTSS